MWQLHCKTLNLKGENIISRTSILRCNNTTPPIHVGLAQHLIKTDRERDLSQGMDDFDFTITFYYWGKIRNNPYRYKGGEVKIYEDNNSDEMLFVEIWNKAKNFEFSEIDVLMYRVPTMPFAGGLKPLENDVDVMNMVKCIRGYNEVEVYVMFLDDYKNAIGNKGDGGGGDNEVSNFDEGDKVDGAVSEEDNAHRVHFGCSESDNNDMFAQYINSDEIASKVKGLPDDTLCLKKR